MCGLQGSKPIDMPPPPPPPRKASGAGLAVEGMIQVQSSSAPKACTTATPNLSWANVVQVS